MSSDEDSDYKTRKTKSGKKKRKPSIANRRTNSCAKDKFICDLCGFISPSKLGLCRHISRCDGPKSKERKMPPPGSRTICCQWCNVKFNNRGNLVTHVRCVHGDKSFGSSVGMPQSEINEMSKCPSCDQVFVHNFQLIYHIRRMHYNMVSKTPYAMIKKVNQVWFEKVQNSNIIIEMKKIAHNKLLMRKLGENTAIKVNNDHNDIIDVTDLYPTGQPRKRRENCPICDRLYFRRDLKKHISERHHNCIKYRCNNCNRGFKRLYIYLKHVCGKSRINGVINNRETDIQITSVESLAIPM